MELALHNVKPSLQVIRLLKKCSSSRPTSQAIICSKHRLKAGLTTWSALCSQSKHFLSKEDSGQKTASLDLQNEASKRPHRHCWNSFRYQHTGSSSSPQEHPQSSEAVVSRPLPKQTDSLIFYDSDGLIAVNKPQYLSVFGKANQDETETSNLIRTMQDRGIRTDTLRVGLSLKSFYSGVVLMCNNTTAKGRLSKLVSSGAAQKQTIISYLAITVRVPQCPHNEVLESSISKEYLHNKELSVVHPETSKSARKLGDMMSVTYRVRPLVVSETTGAVLVEVSLSKDKWEAAEVLLSHHYSPVLGDMRYDSRTYTLKGVPFPVEAHVAKPGSQKLPGPIQEAVASSSPPPDLDLPASVCPQPLYMHRHRVVLNGFPNKDCPTLTLQATPPPHFLFMLDCLGLHVDESVFNVGST